MGESFENAKAFLKRTSAGEDHSLYDHLSHVLLKIIQEKPSDPVKLFEHISATVKDHRLKHDVLREAQPLSENQLAKEKLQAHLKRTDNLLTPPEQEEVEEQAHIPDILNDAALLEWAGVSLGKEETYKVLLSIRDLTKKRPLISVRLFGKVFGTQSDYLIVEAKPSKYSEQSEDVKDEKAEPPGIGANEYVYFVSSHAGGEWVQLPDVTSEQIRVSRGVRKYLSGNLGAPVPGYPRFPWPEAALLRAIITRVASSTVVAPVDFYRVDGDDENNILENDEFKARAADELEKPESWAHHRRRILKVGRTTPYEPPKTDDDDGDDVAKAAVDQEEVPAALSPLSEDFKAVIGGPAWKFRVSPPGSVHAVASAHSLGWPGAVAVAKGSTFANIYVGFGLPYLGQDYTPPAPFPVQKEFVDNEEEPVLVEQSDPLPPPAAPDAQILGDDDGDDGDGDDGDDGDDGGDDGS